MRQWESIEAKMPNYRTDREKRKLAYQVKMLSLVVLMSSLGKRESFHLKIFVLEKKR